MGLIAEPLPLGAVVEMGQMTECRRMTPAWLEEIPELERVCGDWRPGRNGYCMEAPQLLRQPVSASGVRACGFENRPRMRLTETGRSAYTKEN